jgi:hypothetical protein
MLFATAVFAAVLKLFSPLDSLSLIFAIPISIAIFAFALLAKEPRETIDSRAFSSRRQAVVTGLKRGALFGGKYGAIVAGTLLLFVCVILVCDGKSIGGVGPILLGSAVFIGLPTAFGALLMGIGNGVYYRPSSAQHGNQDGLDIVSESSVPTDR